MKLSVPVLLAVRCARRGDRAGRLARPRRAWLFLRVEPT